jgi:hypothetical protein
MWDIERPRCATTCTADRHNMSIVAAATGVAKQLSTFLVKKSQHRKEQQPTVCNAGRG